MLISAPTRIVFDSNRFESIRIDSTRIAFLGIFWIFSSTRIGKIKIHIHSNCDIFRQIFLENYVNIHSVIHEYSLWIFMNIDVIYVEFDMKNLK